MTDKNRFNSDKDWQLIIADTIDNLDKRIIKLDIYLRNHVVESFLNTSIKQDEKLKTHNSEIENLKKQIREQKEKIDHLDLQIYELNEMLVVKLNDIENDLEAIREESITHCDLDSALIDVATKDNLDEVERDVNWLLDKTTDLENRIDNLRL